MPLSCVAWLAGVLFLKAELGLRSPCVKCRIKALQRGQSMRRGRRWVSSACTYRRRKPKKLPLLGKGGRFADWNILWTLQWLQKCLRMTTAAAWYLKKIRKLSRCPASALVLRVPVRCPLSFLLQRDLEAWICPALYPSLSSGWSFLSSAPEANAVGHPPPSAKLKEVRTAGYARGQCFSAL